MIASLLTDETLELTNVPRLADISSLLRILSNFGVDHMIAGKRPGQTAETGQTVRLSARSIIDTTAPYELVSTMRASFWVIAPLLARLGEARVSMPGGCAIGTRPVDLLIMALERLGASIEIDGGYVVAKAPKGLRGGEIAFPKVTVGGTHVALMAATLAEGTTVIANAAREPEVTDLANCLEKMGAKIEGAGTSQIVVEGVSRLSGAAHDRPAGSDRDRHLRHGGRDDRRRRCAAEHPRRSARVRARRAQLDRGGGSKNAVGIRVARNGVGLRPVAVTPSLPGIPDRSPGPVHRADDDGEGDFGSPRDDFREPLHARAGTGKARCPHRSRRRHRHREGVKGLTGAQVMATDLRASVSLIIAGLAAQGDTMIGRVYHLDRGFERIEEKLRHCGAHIERLSS